MNPRTAPDRTPCLALAIALLLLTTGCRGDAAESASAEVSAETARAGVAGRDAAGGRTADVSESAPPSDSAAGRETPVLTRLPDACELLTRDAAAELLGARVGPGRSADISGLGNCAYRTEADGQLALVVQLGADDRVESTQFAMSFEHCGMQVVARPAESAGVASALFERPSEPCGAALVLWVATGRRFEGRPHPDLVRTVSGRLHLLLSRSPAPSPGDALPILRGAAERVLARLDR